MMTVTVKLYPTSRVPTLCPTNSEPETLMNHKDPPIQREEELRYGEMTAEQKSVMGSSSKPRGFRNHPNDPNNPNQVRERYLQKIRSLRHS
jgi:hypothetical protein